jgi:hypothetical protein
MPTSDPDHGIYNYRDAKAVGLSVPPIPPEEELCRNARSDVSIEGAGTSEARAMTDEPVSSDVACFADPRLAMYSVGYSVEAVRRAETPYEKGRLVCTAARSIPAQIGDPEAYLRSILRNAVGLSKDDDFQSVLNGCLSTEWTKLLLKSG